MTEGKCMEGNVLHLWTFDYWVFMVINNWLANIMIMGNTDRLYYVVQYIHLYLVKGIMY